MLTSEIYYAQKNKAGEEVCGDTVKVKKTEEKTVVSVSDGLGSGIKASILSTLTASMSTTMVLNDVPISEVFSSIISTLPTCKVRGISYATLATCYVNHVTGDCHIFEYDFPIVLFYRDGQFVELEKKEHKIQGRTVLESSIQIKPDDVVFLMTDGISQAGMGTAKYPFGFGIENIKYELKNLMDNKVDLESITNHLVRLAEALDRGSKGDDATVCAIKIRERRNLTIMVGPPEKKEHDKIVVEKLMNSEGKKVICGGTTSQIVEKILGKKVEIDFSSISEYSPPIGHMEGVDLVTEGIITLSQVFRYYENQDTTLGVGAQKLIDLLEESDIITFLVGRAINPAHQNPLFSHDISLKFRIIHDIAAILQQRGKVVKIEYF
ncbi:Stage II sporulation protein E (SpoIIE) [Fervidobacterium changbaicum]|uniref:Stage II sporulation protein n=1 Tax=Fervidobacterium changbaicum TaxID=310769 RepID=A0ABX5QQ47_9BACT|nr:SpoIIE family protein phosphatase [Fervidobacterium changbaicum]QAV32596.1 stage II sporulation protein [Fervidobacterium changbaicum]SDH34016.1 Stage II sporulation protein E (SpoIIE) [Fervidobacterium changbaicum]